MLELKLKPSIGPAPRRHVEQTQPRKQLIALTILLVTFCALLVKDHAFWFGGDSTDTDLVTPAVAHAATPEPVVTAEPIAVNHPAPVAKKQARTRVMPIEQPTHAAVVTTDRTSVPPLDIEIVNGNKHSKFHPTNKPANVEIADAIAPTTNAAERQPMATTIPAPETTLYDAYPRLAGQTKVQGSVVLQAIIGADGNIQDLHVLAGPSIMIPAAQQAVRQWKFKPYYLNGQAVETKARIIVNFTIRVADDSPNVVAGAM
jgi:TonB family protein